MALQTLKTNELIGLYETCLASRRSVDANYPGADDDVRRQIRDARSARLAAIGAELDRRSTAITCNVYQSLAS